jgi:hypothetical protein
MGVCYSVCISKGKAMELITYYSSTGKTKYFGVKLVDGFVVELRTKKAALAYIQHHQETTHGSQSSDSTSPDTISEVSTSQEGTNSDSSIVDVFSSFRGGATSQLQTTGEKHYGNIPSVIRLFGTTPSDNQYLTKLTISAEGDKIQAEQHRINAEQHRINAEQHRINAEQYQREANEHQANVEFLGWLGNYFFGDAYRNAVPFGGFESNQVPQQFNFQNSDSIFTTVNVLPSVESNSGARERIGDDLPSD